MTDNNDNECGLVLWSIGNKARIFINHQEIEIDIPGKWRLSDRQAKPLVPGDKVKAQKVDDQWRLLELIKRKNAFIRHLPGPKRNPTPIPQLLGANLDYTMLVASVKDPTVPFGFIDRLLVSSEIANIPAILVVNKIDLTTKEKLTEWKNTYNQAVFKIIFTSCITGQGIEEVRNALRGKIILLSGFSGVGKSSLINYIDPSLNIKTTEISLSTGKGRHTTSGALMHATSGNGWIVDTPGIREFAPWGITTENLASTFPEIRKLSDKCKFRNCLHKSETKCNVRDHLGTPALPTSRYQSYLKLLEICQISPKYI